MIGRHQGDRPRPAIGIRKEIIVKTAPQLADRVSRVQQRLRSRGAKGYQHLRVDGRNLLVKIGAAGEDFIGGGVTGSQDDSEKDEQKKETESNDDSDDESDDEKKEESDDEKKEEFGLNRFILVSVRFNADLVPKPEFKPLPPVEAQKPAEQKSEPSTETEKSTEKSKDNSEENETSADSKRDETSQNGDSDESADEKKTSSEDEAKKKADEEKAKQEAERKKIEEENKKAQEDYEKKIKDGQESVRKLNYRFADWYFVISEDVYKKIHLGKEDVLKKKEEKEEDSGNGNLPSSLDNIPSNFNLPNFNPPPN